MRQVILFLALNAFHLALAAAEILALAAALILRFLLFICGAAAGRDSPPSIRPSCVSNPSIFSRIAIARLSC